jgi:hypothetical protein
MKKLLLSLIILYFVRNISANDGVYYTSGNQLIPIFETDISVKKEILTIRKINDHFVEVNVYYEFFNPGNEKIITVGFEAYAPEGDADRMPVNGLHPYIDKFTVTLNNVPLQYQVAYVADSLYAQNGAMNVLSESEIKNENNWFYYVYHFKAKFKKGLNIIKHTYTYNLSGSVDMAYNIHYVLTAANRWANRQIDDFTLIFEPGNFESFYIDCNFFTNHNDWSIDGIGRKSFIPDSEAYYLRGNQVEFHIRNGKITFQKKNFKPAGELYIFSMNSFLYDGFDYQRDCLPFALLQQDRLADPVDILSKKILRNLPFARRGYVFTTPEIQKYYETKTNWYIPDKNYKADINALSEKERQFVLMYKD